MTAFTIVLEERDFPSDRVLNTRMERFEPEVVEFRDSDGRVFLRRVEPYRLFVRPFITEFDAGLAPPRGPRPGDYGPIPTPWGPGPSEDVTFYSYLFTIWHQDWTRRRDRLFYTPYPLHFVAYYVSRDSRIDAGSVHAHAVSLRNLRVLEVSPVSGSDDGIVSTTAGEQRVEAASPLRGVSSEGIGGAHFVGWTAWTTPAAMIDPPRSFTGGFTTIERRMTLERNTVGRAVAFYKPFPEPPGRERAPEQEPRLELPFEEYIRQVVKRGDLASVRKALQDIDVRLERLRQFQELLHRRLDLE